MLQSHRHLLRPFEEQNHQYCRVLQLRKHLLRMQVLTPHISSLPLAFLRHRLVHLLFLPSLLPHFPVLPLYWKHFLRWRFLLLLPYLELQRHWYFLPVRLYLLLR